MKNIIYLDHAAATPVDSAVLVAMQPYFAEKFYNPSALYLEAKTVRGDMEAARSSVASMLGVKTSEIIFTAGGTEANNLAIHGVMRQHPNANVVVSAIEHESVLEAAQPYDCKITPVDLFGTIDVGRLESMIDDNTVLVSVMYANNEIGAIQPLARVAQMVKRIRHQRLLSGKTKPLYLHSDACQAANYLNLKNLGLDMMTLNGGKMYGPKQSGILFCHSSARLLPQVYGGGQEHGLRSGTENVPQIIGFTKALEAAQAMRASEVNRLTELRDYACQLLINKIPKLIINGTAHRLLGPNPPAKDASRAVKAGYRLPNNLHITVPGQDNERLMMQLDELGIICAVGSACSASKEEPSHVLKAIGLSDDEARASLRFTMGRSTTKKDIDRVATVLAKLAV